MQLNQLITRKQMNLLQTLLTLKYSKCLLVLKLVFTLKNRAFPHMCNGSKYIRVVKQRLKFIILYILK